jgi:hypothetical protein
MKTKTYSVTYVDRYASRAVNFSHHVTANDPFTAMMKSGLAAPYPGSPWPKGTVTGENEVTYQFPGGTMTVVAIP